MDGADRRSVRRSRAAGDSERSFVRPSEPLFPSFSQNSSNNDIEQQPLRKGSRFRAPRLLPRSAARQQPSSANKQTKRSVQDDEAAVKYVNISLSLPSFNLSRPLKQAVSLAGRLRPKKPKGIVFSRRYVFAVGVLVLLAAGFGGYKSGLLPFGGADGTGSGSAATDGKGETLGQQSAAPAKPPYKTLTSHNTSARPIRYDPEYKVASYTDTIGTIPITVSQQQLPEPFKKDPSGELSKLAENISANDPVEASGLKAYVGTSAKGPQTLVMVKNDLLIFIKSNTKVPKDAWAKYIESLAL